MTKKIPSHLIIVLILGLIVLAVTTISCTDNDIITEDDIIEAQKMWGDGVVNIGNVYSDEGDYTRVATKHVDKLYAYQKGPVLFAPTKASQIQFRTTKDGAISYFVGGNKDFPEDKGFALEPWTKIRFKNAGIYIHDDYAVSMGNYYFTPKDGEEVKVEYTFGYIKDKDGNLKINLHHSALPYSSNK